MDPDRQHKIFETLQEKFNVEDIIPEVVNEYLGNRSHTRTDRWTEYIWRNGVRTKNTRPRERDVKVKASSAKDKIAQSMGQIGEIWSDIEKSKSTEEIDNAKKDLASFASKFKINQTSLDQFNELTENKGTEIFITEVGGELEEADTLEEIFQIRGELSDKQIKTVTRTQLKTKITRKETRIIKSQLAQERGRELVGLSKVELSMRGISSRTTVKSLVKKYNFSQDEAKDILGELDL